MSRDTIQFMMRRILHFESYEDRLVDLEKRNDDLEANLKIVKNQLDKFTHLNNYLIGETNDADAVHHSYSANFAKNPFDDAEILGNLNHTHNHDRRQQYFTYAPQVILEDNEVSTHHNHGQEQSFNRFTTSATGIEMYTTINGSQSQDGYNAKWNDLQIGAEAAGADSGSNFAETENPFEDEILPNQNQDQFRNQSTTTTTTTTTAQAGVIFPELDTILNGPQDDNIENHYLDLTIEEIEIKSESEGNEWDCTSSTISIDENVESTSTGNEWDSTSNTNISIDENVESASNNTVPQITSISNGRARQIKSNVNIFIKNQTVPIPNVDSDSDPLSLSLCPSLSETEISQNVIRAAQLDIRVRTTRSHNYKNTRSKPKSKLGNNFTKKSRKFDCKICTKSFTSLKSLGGHMQVHGSKKKKERQMPKLFPIISRPDEQLKIHSQIHTGEKSYKYKCPNCPKKFTQSHNLVRHKRVHTEGEGETRPFRPYKCSHCPKKFTQSHSLARHKRIHTGEKPYGCEFCPKFFRTKEFLILHTRYHTGERPYECLTCRKNFISKSALNMHRKVH